MIGWLQLDDWMTAKRRLDDGKKKIGWRQLEDWMAAIR
jgi:hypothetical protein